MKKSSTILVVLLIIQVSLNSLFAQGNYSEWEKNLKAAVHTGKLDNLKSFFSGDFALNELKNLNYYYEYGFLNFNKTKIDRLSENSILFFIPTNNEPFTEETDCYFGFIYRIYKIDKNTGGYKISGRCMDDFFADFKNCKYTIKIIPEENLFQIESETETDLKSGYFIFKLAKEFNIEELTVNNFNVNFERFGYFVKIQTDQKNVRLFLKGTIKTPEGNNQFLSVDKKNFFLRYGGFAAVPSPPPDNSGMYEFSKDVFNVDITLIYPDYFQLLMPGEIYKDLTENDKKVISAYLSDNSNFSRSFYAQSDWNVKFIEKGLTRIGFYFPEKDKKESEYLYREVLNLLDWINRKFQNYSDFEINFAVLDKFYIGGLLNDGDWAIVAQNAEIIGSGGEGYIHEVCHSAPQPKVSGNYLWIKEGFTNFLAFEYISYKENSNFWENRKRNYLNYFDMYKESLLSITDYRNPYSLLAYQKAPWIYRMLETVTGKDNFKKIMIEFGKMDGKELENNREYLKIFERIGKQDLSLFENLWLNQQEIPILKTTCQFENKKNNWKVTLKIIQESSIFELPLEIEILTKAKNIRKTFTIDSKVSEFEFFIPDKPVFIKFDPDSRLFAIIKTWEMTTDFKSKIKFPEKDFTYKFKSNSTGEIVEYDFRKHKNEYIISKTSNDENMKLQILKQSGKIDFIKNEVIAYEVDTKTGKINFSGQQYDISEPVYPNEFSILLYSLMDWTKKDKEAMVNVRPGRQRCRLSTAEVKHRNQGNILISIDSYYDKVDLYLSDDIPVKYIIDGKETFELVR